MVNFLLGVMVGFFLMFLCAQLLFHRFCKELRSLVPPRNQKTEEDNSNWWKDGPNNDNED